MPKRVCLISFATTKIEIAVLPDRELEAINFSLAWDVGFRQEYNGRLVACFGEAFESLDSNNPNEIQFSGLDVFFKEITDAETVACIFNGYFEEIFLRRLPEGTFSIYIITPYQWKSIHRRHIRKGLKSVKNNLQIPGFTSPNLVLHCIISQILCLVTCYRQTWEDLLTHANKLHLFLVDCARQDLILYQLVCKQSPDCVTVELSDILWFPDFFINTKKNVSDLQHILKNIEEKPPVVIGFSDTVKGKAKDIIELLQPRCSAIFIEPQGEVTLSGATELIRQFRGESIAKPLHFVYNFCFGVQLPDGRWVELVPKTWTPPYHRKKAFRITGTLNKIYIPLFCGISLSDNSDVHHLATIEIDSLEDSNFSSRNSREFILSVTLNDATHGTFTVHFPSPRKPISVNFEVPVLMD